MRRRRRVMLAVGALAAVAAHCVAVAEPADRRLITFDETHNALTDTVTEVANEAVDTANNIVSAVLGGVTRTDSNDETTGSPSASISVTIGGDSTSDEDEAAEKSTTTDSGEEESTDTSFNDDDNTPTAIAASETSTPSGVSVSVSGSAKEETTSAPTTTRPTTSRPTTTRPRTTRHSGVSHAVSMTKRPGTTAPTSDSTGNESTDNSYTDSATPTAAPARTTQAPASEASVSTEAPVVSVPTPTPVTIILTTPTPPATEAPAAAPVTTDSPVVVAVPTDIPAAVDTPMSTTQSSSVSGSSADTGVIDDEPDAPASAGSTSTDAVIITPDESTVMPLATTGAPAVDTGSSDPASDTPSTGPATWTDSSSSSSSNETVTVSSASGEGTSEGTSPGQVHASSSADVSLDGSDELDVESSHSSHGPKQKKNKTKKETHSSSGDYSAGGSRSSNFKSSASNSGSSGDGSSGMGAFLNPGGVSDVNTSSATYYSLGTGSIVAIVGVIAGIMGLLVLFVAISRKKYSDDDGESPLPYGYNMDIRSVARLSPTFMQDDSFMESGYNGTALMVAMAPPTYDGASSTSGESADEVPSLRGHRMVTNQCDPLADISLRSRVPSAHSFSGDLDTGNVRVSALYSAGSSVTSGSAISGSWSSVLASDTERQPSRNTRDTTLSAWSAANLSSFGSTASGASGASGMYRMTRSSSAISALSGDLRHTGGSDRSRSSSRLARQPEATRVAAGPVDSNRSNKSTEI
ncbi:hypothetical protein V7S43_007235 [Phytophthora oleae]|uniref:Uncharacterized protein n=1 Tax=Phytophthora oleae TaxID=2107226 RepID=A0ABD3FLA0_9STRA